MIHVCFALCDKTGRYSKFTGTAMLSILENTTSKVTVHILHDSTLTADNRNKFSYIAGQYGQVVKFYNVEKICAGKLNEIKRLAPKVIKSSFTVATMYRLLIPQILPPKIEKVIYLDSDIVVNLNIAELWRIELDDKPLAAADEVRADFFEHKTNAAFNYLVKIGSVDYNDYFNAGVLLMNLDALRTDEDRIMSGVKFYGEHPQLNYFDQDVLNYLYSKSYLKLPEKFNSFVRKERQLSKSATKKIYHFVGSAFSIEMRDPFNRLWLDYFAKTPWFDAQAICNICNEIQNLHVGLKQSMINLSALMSGKTRAFFIAPQIVNDIKKLFSVRVDEEIILAEDNESLQKLLDAMNASHGKKIFFIVLQAFPFGLLTKLGFVNGREFVNGIDFLSEAQGVPFDSHPLIKAM